MSVLAHSWWRYDTSRNYLMELARAAVICECVGAQLVEI